MLLTKGGKQVLTTFLIATFLTILLSLPVFSDENITRPLLFLDKKEYFLDDPVIIQFNLEPDYKVSVLTSEGDAYRYMGVIKSPLTFFPKKPGDYTIQVARLGIVLDSKSFKVKPLPETKADVQEHIKVMRKNLNPLKYNFNFDETPEFEFEYKNNFEASYNFLPHKSPKKLVTSEGVVEAFVYDPKGKPAQVSAELEETIDGVHIKLREMRDAKPGVYKLKVKLTKDGEEVVEEKEFAWGLISLNTRKSIYKPGETAELIIILLDSNGYGVCNAPVGLTLTDPGGKVHVYTSNDFIQDSECGLYYAKYPTRLEGTHFISVMAHVDGKDLSFDTHFQVQQDYDYEIIRATQSKIDPTQVNLFDVLIEVESYKNDEVLAIKEYVPNVFKITDTSARVTEGNPKVLQWDVKGSKASLTYKYSVPLKWPYLYKLGPLTVNGFEEARPWYVAVDPPPELHTVEGYVFINEEGLQAPTGVKLLVNSSSTQQMFSTETYGPPGETGYYALSVNGSDGDEIVVTSYNATFYGRVNASLASNPSITEANLTLNITRDAEANVTITSPSNGTSFYLGNTFEASSVVMVLGSDGVGCSAVISFSDESVLNISSGESYNHSLESISRGDSTTTSWNVKAVGLGSSSIIVNATCANSGVNIEGLDSFTVYNLGVSRGAPSLHSVEGYVFMLDGDTQMPSGTMVMINATETGTYTETETYGPPGHTGYYSTAELNATDAEPVIVTAVNSSDFGQTNTTLLASPSVTEANVTMNLTNIPDIFISSSDINFSNPSPMENENITINITVYNIVPYSHADNFVVSFYKGNPEEGVQINENITIGQLLGLESITVGTTWLAEIGATNASVRVDSGKSVSETDENNNDASDVINVGAYQTVIGNTSANLTLDDSSGKILINWSYFDIPVGSVFLADEDDTNGIDFTSLQAIGKNTAGGDVINDFTDIDYLLNMTDLRDNLTYTYTSDGSTPEETDSFLIFQINITGVPVVNSTNNTDFRTGMLWDTNDDMGNAQFDINDKEDLVFVTKVNQNKYGEYGLYDYEITYPVNLRKYKEPGTSKVVMYYELS